MCFTTSHSHRPVFHDTSMQTDAVTIFCHSSTPTTSVNSSNPSLADSTATVQQRFDPNFQYSILRKRSSIQLKISNQYLCDNPKVVLSKDRGSETFSMSAKAKSQAKNITTAEQCTSMEKGDFISFDYEVVDSDDSDYFVEQSDVNTMQEKNVQTDGMIKGKDIVERLAWLLRSGEGDVRPKSDRSAENTVEAMPLVTEKETRPEESNLSSSSNVIELPDPETDSVHLIYSDSSSDSEVNDTVIEKTNFEPFQVPNNSPIPTPTPPLSSETTNSQSAHVSDHSKHSSSSPFSSYSQSSSSEDLSKLKFLQNMSTITSTATISTPISCVRFPVRLNQPPVQRIHRKLPEAQPKTIWPLFVQTNCIKRVGLAGIYCVLFLVMFTALALPELQCL